MRRIEAARFGAEDVLRLVDAEFPPPGPGDVAIDVRAAGVNPVDTYIRMGTYEFLRPPLPVTPGFDGAGVVTAIGEGVHTIETGARVWISMLPGRTLGTYAEALVCDSGLVHPLPDDVGFEAGAAIGVPYTTAYRALVQRGGARAGETVLVHGASGGVGIPTVQLARALGLTVIGTAGTESGRAAVLANGADHVLDHRAPGYLDEIPRLTDGRGVDLVVEMVAGENLQRDLGLLARHGRIVVVGSRAPVEIVPRALMVAEADIRGIALWNMSPADFADAHAGLDDLLRTGAIRPVPGTVLPLADAAEAHRRIAAGEARGKIVLAPA